MFEKSQRASTSKKLWGKVRAGPTRQDLLVPQKIMGQGTSWSQEAGSTRTLELCAHKNQETLVCDLNFPGGRISLYPWVV